MSATPQEIQRVKKARYRNNKRAERMDNILPNRTNKRTELVRLVADYLHFCDKHKLSSNEVYALAFDLYLDERRAVANPKTLTDIIRALGPDAQPDAVQSVRDACFHLASCWDALREFENITEAQINEEDIASLAGEFCVPASSDAYYLSVDLILENLGAREVF